MTSPIRPWPAAAAAAWGFPPWPAGMARVRWKRRFGATDGDQTTGGQISFGPANSSNRALGLLATSTTGGTAFGVRFINGTGITLNRMNLQFTGEVWRQSNLAKTLQFYYFVDPTGTAHFPDQRDGVSAGLECELPHGGGGYGRGGGGRHLRRSTRPT